MEGLDKTEIVQKARLVKNLHGSAKKLEKAIEHYNQAREAVRVEAQHYRDLVEEADDFRGYAQGLFETFIEEESVKRTRAVKEWLARWGEALKFNFDEPSELKVPELDHADLLEELPNEPEEKPRAL